MNILQKGRRSWIKFEESITNFILLAIVGLVFFEVLVRAVGKPTTWSVGLAQLLFIWMIFIGSNQALRKGVHVGVDALTDLFSEKVQSIITIIMHVLVALLLGFMVYYGMEMFFANTGRLISGTNIKYNYITLAIPVGCLLMLFTTIEQLILTFKKGNKKESELDI